MRGRWLKPEFFRDKKIGLLGPIPALVYQALWCVADDGGTARCEVDQLKADMFLHWPSITVEEIENALVKLEESRRISGRYRAGDDVFCRILNFGRHQRVHNASKFRYPQVGAPLTGATASALPQPSGSPRILESYNPIIPPSQGGVGTEAVGRQDYIRQCVDACNQEQRAHPHIGLRFTPLAVVEQIPRVAWDLDGIPAEVALSVIRETIRAFRPDGKHRQISSLAYFDEALRRQWSKIKSSGVTSAADVPGARDVVDAAWLKAQGY